MTEYRIGDVSRLLGLSVDTLRYYEKIGLLQDIPRNSSGIRVYLNKHLSQLKFIQRTQKMNFSLAEIKDLLQMRQAPQHARKEVRQLTKIKLEEIEAHLVDLTTLRDELSLLVNLCIGSEDGCPIIENMDKEENDSSAD
ncbi:MAG TPA: heavy metal-responsive transcriptional regulator [Gammaproteobacteria bacterium]|nr:heavy metal-responsive transcriptional regulator [Gammaproteobacteria bacterium]